MVPQPNFGADLFTFTGDRTTIVYYPQTPGPITLGQEGGKLEYQGVEGDFTFFGPNIDLQESPLGTLLTVILKPRDDFPGITITVLVPNVSGVTEGNPVTFETLAIKASSRGFILSEGADLTYTVLPLLTTANDEIMPLSNVK